MNKIAITLASLLFASVAYAGDMKPTEGETMEQATIVVYRNDADIRSRRLSFDVVMGAEDLGRMRDDVIVSHVDAGTYELQTSLPGDEPIELQLQPGATYYVQAGLSVRGGQVKVELEEVGEQVARNEIGELPEGNI